MKKGTWSVPRIISINSIDILSIISLKHILPTKLFLHVLFSTVPKISQIQVIIFAWYTTETSKVILIPGYPQISSIQLYFQQEHYGTNNFSSELSTFQLSHRNPLYMWPPDYPHDHTTLFMLLHTKIFNKRNVMIKHQLLSQHRLSTVLCTWLSCTH